MIRILSAHGMFLAALAVWAAAADLTGTWKGPLPPRDATVREMTFRLKQAGGQLTGAVVLGGGEESPITEGKVKAGEFSFALVGPRGKMVCKGTFSGNQMKMIQSRDGSPDLTRELVLRRQ